MASLASAPMNAFAVSALDAISVLGALVRIDSIVRIGCATALRKALRHPFLEELAVAHSDDETSDEVLLATRARPIASSRLPFGPGPLPH